MTCTEVCHLVLGPSTPTFHLWCSSSSHLLQLLFWAGIEGAYFSYRFICSISEPKIWYLFSFLHFLLMNSQFLFSHFLLLSWEPVENQRGRDIFTWASLSLCWPQSCQLFEEHALMAASLWWRQKTFCVHGVSAQGQLAFGYGIGLGRKWCPGTSLWHLPELLTFRILGLLAYFNLASLVKVKNCFLAWRSFWSWCLPEPPSVVYNEFYPNGKWEQTLCVSVLALEVILASFLNFVGAHNVL